MKTHVIITSTVSPVFVTSRLMAAGITSFWAFRLQPLICIFDGVNGSLLNSEKKTSTTTTSVLAHICIMSHSCSFAVSLLEVLHHPNGFTMVTVLYLCFF